MKTQNTPTQSKYVITIYTENSPNPNSMKFVFNTMVVEEGETYEFVSKKDAKKSPLAESLFDFIYVTRVFFMSNFITITKNKDYQWGDIINELKSFLQTYFQEEKSVLDPNLVKNKIDETSDDPLVGKIKTILKEYVNPAVQADGGLIHYHSFDISTGTLSVLLQGACSGCPSSTITLKNGIEELMKSMVPQVKQVVSENI